MSRIRNIANFETDRLINEFIRLLIFKELQIIRIIVIEEMRNIPMFGMSREEVHVRTNMTNMKDKLSDDIDNISFTPLSELYTYYGFDHSKLETDAKTLMKYSENKILERGLYPYTVLPNSLRIVEEAKKYITLIYEYQNRREQHYHSLQNLSRLSRFKEIIDDVIQYYVLV